MSNIIVKHVPGSETEGPLGTILSTPPHWVIAWGEYADQGEADGDVRVMVAIDESGRDDTEQIAHLIAGAIQAQIDEREPVSSDLTEGTK